ncbi:unnamed protein product [Psylliodes chrysocephalus]|uniref:Farnesol dehydrogenase-like n=1 Tax=Psylliodes chrysocephalus TaxID=3402493 RepID=A0A9P0CMN1_9CUCU|nr:unnamed protein product [Psylliodes chrysocephala]
MVLSMERWVGKVAVVTGASAGIGAAIAKQLVEHGLLVVGVARRKERIDELAKTLEGKKGKLFAFKADISIGEEIKAAFAWTTDNVGPVAILVNNAGIHYRTTIIDGDVEAWRKTIDVNLMATCIASKEAIHIMRKNNIDGHVININSILGHYIFKLPNLDIYPATKYGITALTETLRLEINSLKLKIKVTSVSPGVVNTEIFENMDRKQFDLVKNCMLNPEDIADGVVYALSTPPHVQVHEITIKPVGEDF